MERILLLNESRFPDRFDLILSNPPSGVSKGQYAENRIVEAFNNYYPNLDLNRIEYLKIENQFEDFKKNDSNGLVVEEFEINPELKEAYENKKYYVYEQNGKTFCRKIMLYVFISLPNEDSRNNFISQTVFPTLLQYAGEYLDSPSYLIANHKFCFVNILDKRITSKMILRHLASLCLVGMDYIDAFDNESLIINKLPLDIKELLENYSSEFSVQYSKTDDTYEDDCYKIDFSNKEFIIKTDYLISCIQQTTPNQVDFHGSGEKHYWMEILPMSLLAYKRGYSVDYSQYEDFIDSYSSSFSKSSKKFARCIVLLNYIKKYFK